MMEPLQVPNDNRIAMLIDGDNAQPSLMDKVLAEAGKYGLVTIRRIYGDWTMANMNSWKETLHIHAFQPIQQFRYTVGKNSTDSAMIIDAMDILYSNTVNGFCLVSSDSDYTRLATRIREKGFFVMGIGRKTTPRAFVSACEVFVYTENLLPPPIVPDEILTKRGPVASVPGQPEPLAIIKSAVEISLQDDGWAPLGTVGNRLRQLDPGFDPRTFGYRQLSHLVRQLTGSFELKEVKTRNGPTHIYIRPLD